MPTPVDQAIASYNAAAGIAPMQTDQDAARQNQGQDRSPGAFLGDLWDAVVGKDGGLEGQAEGTADVAKDLAGGVKQLAVGKGTVLGDAIGGKAAKAPAAKTKTTTTTDDDETPSEAEIKAQIQAGSLWNDLGQQIVAAQANLDKPVEQSISGALTGPAESSAATQALASMGLAPDSSASKWLNSQIAQANANDSPLSKAMDTYTQEYETGQSGVSAALASMGQANALDVDTAPQADWVQSLAQHIMGNVNYYGEISPSQAASLTPAVLSALLQSGGGGASAAGDIPFTDTPSQVAAAVQNYYAKQPTANLPSTQKAATGSAGGGTGGVIPSDTGTAPG